MPTPEYRIISIGTLAAHPLWEESQPVRTGHATTTLIEAGDAKIIINPSLPAPMLAARMEERSNVSPADITHVFISTFTIDHYRGLPLFPDAKWLVHEPERMCSHAALQEQHQHAQEIGDVDNLGEVKAQLDLLGRCADAEDHIAPGVDLFPLPGLSPGTCGVLLPLPTSTILICGDAVATIEHLHQGKVLPGCMDIELAQESFQEAIEIADMMVLGRDNHTLNPLRPGM